jgi:endonuclease YncB( thermonuclease family)
MPRGEYEVILNRSCAYEEGGSYQIIVGDLEILGSIVGAGEWTDWKNEHVGDIEIGAAPNVLRIVSQTITNEELMFIRSIIVAQKGTWERMQAGQSIEASNIQNEKPLNLRRFDGVTLDDSQSISGDSFYVKHGDNRYQLRLLFVDAPSGRLDLSDLSDREKAKTEATYFGISPESAIRVGKMAESLTGKFLANKEFSAYVSQEEDESGRRMAMVSIGDKFLSQLLVENGLARIYGKQASIPQGLSASAFLATLKEAEAKARVSRKGAWGL